MLRVILLVLIILSSVNSSKTWANNFSEKQNNLFISPPEKTLKIGEKLEYSLEILGIPIGKIELNTLGIEKISGHDCYHITAVALPNSFFAKFYDIQYTVHTYMDKESLVTRRFEKIRRYQDKTTKIEIDFNPEQGNVSSKIKGKAKSIKLSAERTSLEAKVPKSFKIVQGAQDIFSTLYYLRLKDIAENKDYSIDIYYDNASWKFTFNIGKVQLKSIRKRGSFKVFEVLMNSELNRYVLGTKGMSVILSADAKRIPLEFKFGTGLGTIKGKIKEIPKNE